MENEFEGKILRAMKKFEGKNVKVTQAGIIESKFIIKKLKYTLEEGILLIESEDENYLEIDLDDIEKLYLESVPNGYIILVLDIGKSIELELQINDDNVVSIRDKILKWIDDTGIMEEIYKETCNA